MDPRVAAEIATFARAFLAHEGIAHAVVAVRHDGETYAFAVGDARIDERLPIASIAKSFTALVVAGCGVDLDDTVQQHLPIFPFPETTIRSVLAHESGLVSGLDVSPSPLGGVLLLRDTELGPAGVYRRSNTGYEALGLVAERVSGESYEALVQRHVLEPLGLQDSSGVTTAADRPAWATHAPWVATASGAGSAMCTAIDLVRFAAAMPSLPPPHALDDDDEDGFQRVGLSGDCPGFASHAYACRETGAAVAVLWADTAGSTWQIVQHALAAMRGEDVAEYYTWEAPPEPTGVRYGSHNPWCPWVVVDLEASTIAFPWGPEALQPLPDGRFRVGAEDAPETLELRDPLDGVAVTAVVAGAHFHRMEL
jgi:CubicO group peptidase (beta-lactamase class C family)